MLYDAVECEICLKWIHRRCARLTKQELLKLSNDHFCCSVCLHLMPFNCLSNDELLIESTNIDIDHKLQNVRSKCQEISLNYNEASLNNDHDWEFNINPDLNFYNDMNFTCNYYNEYEFDVNVRKVNGFSIKHFNSRSLQTNFEAITNYLDLLKKDFHVIAISETWLNKNIIDDFNMSGYNTYSTLRCNRKGGGVSIYVSNKLNVTRKVSLSTTIDDILESITIEIHVQKGKNIIVSCIYRSPGTDLQVCNFLENALKNVNHNKYIYICGDFNIDLLKTSDHAKSKEYIDMLYSFGLFPTILKPSRIAGQSATLIDNIFTNAVATSHYSGLMINDISDHLPVFCVSQIKEFMGTNRYILEIYRNKIWMHLYYSLKI